ncbi:GxxExxY protein [Pelagicoccus sp. SDUM812003]|uniref:GxxExxY protein n=1 Tax=Pelagicoccus sp. SDUM812003 TaxID=3041267 RepID=UPI00281046B9|nr:GxxExxY protein [Pelagicoccus sp. SDUM812003]MDQ8204506.1 GxxExxY protein [Pelagicoccus sp. SDUM812003]
MSTNQEVLFADECYKLVGAAFEVYNELGSEFLEQVYQEAYEFELNSNSIPFVSQPPLHITYKGHTLNKEYFADLIAYHEILIELKAIEKLTKREESQILNYLRASNLRLGILINFGHDQKLEWKRIIR